MTFDSSSSPSTRTVLVLGANGRFGMAAARAFADAGWHVIAHVRRDAAAGMPAHAELLRAPLDGVGAALEACLAGSAAPAVVVYGVNPIYTRWKAEALASARIGMDIAERCGARFMLPGNVYNHGEGMPALIDEATPQRPTTEKGRIRVVMERELEGRAGTGRLRATVITAGDFFGAGSGSWLDLLVAKRILAGRIDYPGALELVHAWAYLPDLARAFAAAADPGRTAPFERFTFAGHSVTGEAFVAALERAATDLRLAPGRAWRHGRMPWHLLRLLGAVVPMWRELARMSYLWRVPHALDGRALEAAVGPLPGTPLVEALAASLRELGFVPAEAAQALAARIPVEAPVR